MADVRLLCLTRAWGHGGDAWQADGRTADGGGLSVWSLHLTRDCCCHGAAGQCSPQPSMAMPASAPLPHGTMRRGNSSGSQITRASGDG
eukprot:363412-Chlamydomonas_euryale.AAC.4